MARFLIEVPHEEEKVACARAVKILMETGSHYLTNADFGCEDGVHMGWVTVEADNKEEAGAILPAAYRTSAKITQLNKFTIEHLDEIISHHKD